MENENKMKDILEPLQFALKLEHEGKKFFLEAAQRSTGTLPRQTFQFLADEEDKHIAHIEAFYRSLVDSDDAAPPTVDDTATDGRFSTFYEGLEELKDSISPDGSDIEAYHTAIKFENGAEEFYAEQAAKTDKPHIRTFYNWLIVEEERHAKLLKNCVDFAADPASWFKRGKTD